MNRILVPLDHYSDLSRNASYYAIEFAKRTNSRVLFLFVSDSHVSQGESPNLTWKKSYEKMKEKIDAFIEQGHPRTVEVEYHFCTGEYVNIVSEFAMNHKISKIVMAISRRKDLFSERMNRNVELLRSKIKGQIIVVTPKDAMGESTVI